MDAPEAHKFHGSKPDKGSGVGIDILYSSVTSVVKKFEIEFVENGVAGEPSNIPVRG